jgi:GNAT superfamily N-acetyltransferase
VTVAHLLRPDLDRAAITLAAGFADDPFFQWIFPDVGRRAEQLRRFMRLNAEQYLDRGHAYCAGAVEAVALWMAPDGRRAEADDRAVRHLVRDELGPDGLDRVLSAFTVIGRQHPEEPHYYLSTLATHPDRQGRGLGAAVVQDVLDRCDAMGLPAYLESSNPRNLPFYGRLGFEATGRIEVPGAEDVLVTPMWREPLTPA